MPNVVNLPNFERGSQEKENLSWLEWQFFWLRFWTGENDKHCMWWGRRVDKR